MKGTEELLPSFGKGAGEGILGNYLMRPMKSDADWMPWVSHNSFRRYNNF